MYIIELFFKIKEKIEENKQKKHKKIVKNEQKETCEHIFMPIDSTGKILACSKCGFIYKLKKGEKNPFSN